MSVSWTLHDTHSQATMSPNWVEARALLGINLSCESGTGIGAIGPRFGANMVSAFVVCDVPVLART